jgi:hypothetical protein
MPKGPRGERRPADVIGGAAKVMRIATGEEPDDRETTASAAAQLGKLGGTARAKKLTPDERKEIARKAAALREIEAQKDHMCGAYRDPELAANKLDELIEKSGHDLRAAARVLQRDGPEVLCALKGREGWLVSRAAEGERARARSAGMAIAASLEREVAARGAAVRHRLAEVERQRARCGRGAGPVQGGARHAQGRTVRAACDRGAARRAQGPRRPACRRRARPVHGRG